MNKAVYDQIVWLLVMPALVFGVNHHIDMIDFAFEPDSINISAGDTVLWVNHGAMTHTSTSGTGGVPDGNWDSGPVSPGGSFEFVFDSEGAFPYYCAPHWQLGMTGTIIVQGTGVEEVDKHYLVSRVTTTNYPNPFRGATTIAFELPYAARVEIKVFVASGEYVQTLQNASLSAGYHEVQWSGRDHAGSRVPQGVYFYELNVNGEKTRHNILFLH